MSFFLNANYAIDANTTFFARGTFAANESFGRFAPTTFTSGPFLPGLFQDNPNNPTNPAANPTNALGQAFDGQSVDTDGDGAADVDGPFDVSVLYRSVPGGFRDTHLEDTLVDYLAGVQGYANWFGGTEWQVGAQYSEQTSDSESPGLALKDAFQNQLDSGALDIFAANTDTGDFARGLEPGWLQLWSEGWTLDEQPPARHWVGRPEFDQVVERLASRTAEQRHNVEAHLRKRELTAAAGE